MSKEDNEYEEPVPSESGCVFCGKETRQFHNYCSGECVIAAAKASGGSVIAPNNLEITCVKFDGTMLEHEHADHPTYIMPVQVEFFGQKPEKLPDWDSSYEPETHALIYTDSCVALTMYECTYCLWSVSTNRLIHSDFGMIDKNWRLSAESLKKVIDYHNKTHVTNDVVKSDDLEKK